MNYFARLKGNIKWIFSPDSVTRPRVLIDAILYDLKKGASGLITALILVPRVILFVFIFWVVCPLVMSIKPEWESSIKEYFNEYEWEKVEK